MLKRLCGNVGWRFNKVEVAQTDVKVVISSEPTRYLRIPDIKLPDLALCLGPKFGQSLIAPCNWFRWRHRASYLIGKQVIRSFAVRRRQEQDLAWWYLGIPLDFD